MVRPAFTVVDTGGWLSGDDPLDAQVSAQAERAIAEADVVLLVVDVTVGLTDEDPAVARVLKRSGRPVRVVVNKVDSDHGRPTPGTPWPSASATRGRSAPCTGGGPATCSTTWCRCFPTGARAARRGPPDRWATPATATAVATWWATAARRPTASPGWPSSGRPNVGKSTLFNRLVGDERSVTHDAPGTTRDAVDTVVETPEGTVRFIDTAGMRRKSRTERGTEYFSVLRALQALDRADIALLVIDATAGVTHQDQRLAERVDAAGCPTVVVLNKWELIATEDRTGILADIGDRLAFLGDAPVLKISALSGLGVHHILPAVAAAEEAYHSRIPTGELNRALKADPAGPPAGRGQDPVRRAGGQRPPDVHPVHQRPAPADLPPLRRAGTPRAVRPRTDPDQAPGPGQGGQRGWGSATMTRRQEPAMPWCEQCDQRVETGELAADGTCPVCGTEPLEHRKSPWYFKFMLVASVIYLGYRAFQGVTWVVHHI